MTSSDLSRHRPDDGRSVARDGIDASAQLAIERRRSKLVLCIDDDPSIREIVRHCLTEAGYPVVACRDGVMSLSLLVRYQPRLILLDIEMPEMDGFQTLVEIRSRFPALTAKVLFLTGRRTAGNVQMAREVGGHDYLIKPFTRSNLVRRLDHWAGV